MGHKTSIFERYLLLLFDIRIGPKSQYVLLERTFRNKIFVDPKIGELCDVTACRISFIRAISCYFPLEFQPNLLSDK